MRLYLRLALLDFLAVSLLLTFRQASKNSLAVVILAFITPVVLGAANFAMARKATRQGRISSLDGSRWWSAVSWAWWGGSLCVAAFPLAIALAIARKSALSAVYAALFFLSGLRFLSEVYWREKKI